MSRCQCHLDETAGPDDYCAFCLPPSAWVPDWYGPYDGRDYVVDRLREHASTVRVAELGPDGETRPVAGEEELAVLQYLLERRRESATRFR